MARKLGRTLAKTLAKKTTKRSKCTPPSRNSVLYDFRIVEFV